MSDTKRFPEGFLWGAATASYQVEGGIENTDWAEAAREGRVPVCGRACDHYYRYEEDFDIAKELGHTAHRLSVEWARIEPAEGLFDERAIDHYRKVLAALRARGIKPYVTLWHFTLPLWFVEKGGFEHTDAAAIFARYARYVAAGLGDLCDQVSTINEPMVVGSQGWLTGEWPPFKRAPFARRVAMQDRARTGALAPTVSWRNPFLYFFRVEPNFIRAHNAAYDAIKEVAPHITVSIVKHTVYFHADGTWFNVLRAKIANWLWTYRFMNRVIARCDAIGLNYYQHKKFGDTATYERSDMGWEIYPEGIHGALMLLARYRKPLFVSEAGVADAGDAIRGEYIRKQVEGTWRAIQDGADVQAHLYWSLLDNYEWALGFEKRFGLIAIDYETLERTVRPSAYVYKEIIERNAVLE